MADLEETTLQGLDTAPAFALATYIVDKFELKNDAREDAIADLTLVLETTRGIVYINGFVLFVEPFEKDWRVQCCRRIVMVNPPNEDPDGDWVCDAGQNTYISKVTAPDSPMHGYWRLSGHNDDLGAHAFIAGWKGCAAQATS